MEKQYACIKDSIVQNVIVVDDENLDFIEDYKISNNYDLLLEATINSEPGGEYDGEFFWRKKPYPSAIKNYETNEWEPPVPYPFNNEGKYYIWDEETINWKEIL